MTLASQTSICRSVPCVQKRASLPVLSALAVALLALSSQSSSSPAAIFAPRSQPPLSQSALAGIERAKIIRLARRSPAIPSVSAGADGIPMAGCRSSLPLSTFTRLNSICEDCYGLYKQQEVYTLCRSDCFGTPFFSTCMETLMVGDDFRTEVAAYLQQGAANTLYSKKK